MPPERLIGMLPPPIDPTTDNRWLLQHSDRLIHYEYEQRRKRKDTSEMFPDELSDKIGRPKEYVSGVIKNAIARAKNSLGGNVVS